MSPEKREDILMYVGLALIGFVIALPLLRSKKVSTASKSDSSPVAASSSQGRTMSWKREKAAEAIIAMKAAFDDGASVSVCQSLRDQVKAETGLTIAQNKNDLKLVVYDEKGTVLASEK